MRLIHGMGTAQSVKEARSMTPARRSGSEELIDETHRSRRARSLRRLPIPLWPVNEAQIVWYLCSPTPLVSCPRLRGFGSERGTAHGRKERSKSIQNRSEAVILPKPVAPGSRRCVRADCSYKPAPGEARPPQTTADQNGIGSKPSRGSPVLADDGDAT